MKPGFYFLLVCALIGVSAPILWFNPIKKGAVPFDISMKDLTGVTNNEQPKNQVSPNPTNQSDNQTQTSRSTNGEHDPIQTQTTQTTPTDTNATESTARNINVTSTANAVTMCGSGYDSVNFRISPSIDYTSRDNNGNDLQVLLQVACNQPITVNYSRMISNSDGVWYHAVYQGKSGWINKVCFTPINNVLYN